MSNYIAYEVQKGIVAQLRQIRDEINLDIMNMNQAEMLQYYHEKLLQLPKEKEKVSEN